MWEVSAPTRVDCLGLGPREFLTGLTPQGRSLRAGQWGWGSGIALEGFLVRPMGSCLLALAGGRGRDPACRLGHPSPRSVGLLAVLTGVLCVPTRLEQTANRGAQELACVEASVQEAATLAWPHGAGPMVQVAHSSLLRAALTEDTLPTPCPGIERFSSG